MRRAASTAADARAHRRAAMSLTRPAERGHDDLAPIMSPPTAAGIDQQIALRRHAGGLRGQRRAAGRVLKRMHGADASRTHRRRRAPRDVRTRTGPRARRLNVLDKQQRRARLPESPSPRRVM